MIPLLSRADIKDKKTCVLRVDFNSESNKDLFRLDSSLPTISFLRKKKKNVVLIAHRGRPVPFLSFSGFGHFSKAVTPPFSSDERKKYTLKPFARILSKKIREKVAFLDFSDFDKVRETIEKSKSGIYLLENIRFWKEEEWNDERFAETISSLGDFYVNDAFSVSHRENASVCAITKYLPSYAGLLLEREIEKLNGAMDNPKRPIVFLIGGAKISDKIGMIDFFWRKADFFLFGGGPANTVLSARGVSLGNSLIDEKSFDTIRPYLASLKIKVPQDAVSEDGKILDIGEQTIKEYEEVIMKSKTVVWSGPMGLFEKKKFSRGTRDMWKAVLRLAKKNARAGIIVGGGETIASLSLLITHYKLPKNIFLSTGGSAMLEYLSGKKLPGIEALKTKI